MSGFWRSGGTSPWRNPFRDRAWREFGAGWHGDGPIRRAPPARDAALYFVSFEGTIPHRGPDVHRFEYVDPVGPDPTGGFWWDRKNLASLHAADRRRSTWGAAGLTAFRGRTDRGRRQRVDHTELRFANGVALREDATHGVALFITDETVAMPAKLVMLDRAGKEIATDRPFLDIYIAAPGHFCIVTGAATGFRLLH
jgi:hypothetical protein